MRDLPPRSIVGRRQIDALADRADKNAFVDEAATGRLNVESVAHLDCANRAADANVGDLRQRLQWRQRRPQMALDGCDLLSRGSRSNRSSEALAAAQPGCVAHVVGPCISALRRVVRVEGFVDPAAGDRGCERRGTARERLAEAS